MCKAGPLNGTIPVPKKARDALERTNNLQDQIVHLEAMDCHTETGKMIAKFKQEIAKLKPKLPKTFQWFENHANILEAIKEAREKEVIRENQLNEQIQRAKDAKQQIVLKLQQDKKEIDDYAEARKRCTRKPQGRGKSCKMRPYWKPGRSLQDWNKRRKSS